MVSWQVSRAPSLLLMQRQQENIFKNGSLGPCPFLVVFVQIKGSLPCSKAPPGAGEGAADTGERCQQPLHRKTGKTNQGDGGIRDNRGIVI